MRRFRIPLWKKRSNVHHTFFHEDTGREDGFMVRIPTDRVPVGVTYLPLRTELDPSGVAERFVAFLLESVVERPGGRVSVGAIWSAWADRNGVDSVTPGSEIAGVQYRDVGEHFRDAFDAGPLGRGRLDGVVQRVWHGFELSGASDPSTRHDSPDGIESAVDPRGPGDPYTVRGHFDKETSISYRYELKGEGVRGRIYLDKGLVGESGRPPHLDLLVRPMYDQS